MAARPCESLTIGALAPRVIDAMVKRAVGGEIQLNYAPSGLEWRLTSPATNALKNRLKLTVRRRVAALDVEIAKVNATVVEGPSTRLGTLNVD